MYTEIKNELFNELPIEGNINYQYEFERAYNQVTNTYPIGTKDVIKDAIKAILIEKLTDNANATHKTKVGRILAFISGVTAKVLKFIKI